MPEQLLKAGEPGEATCARTRIARRDVVATVDRGGLWLVAGRWWLIGGGGGCFVDGGWSVVVDRWWWWFVVGGGRGRGCDWSVVVVAGGQ